MGFELMTSSLPRMRSTPELHRLNGAEDEVRTRDPQLGRLMLYQLSYFRGCCGRRWTRTTEPEGADLQSAAIAAMRSSRYSFDTALGRLEPIEGFEPPNPKERIYSPPRLASSLPFQNINKWRETESNRRHMELQSIALPTELPSLIAGAGFEPTTFGL